MDQLRPTYYFVPPFWFFTSLICFQQPQKGKPGTKGQKQILEENKTTLKFYRNMIAAVSVVYVVFNLVFGNVFSLTNIVRKPFRCNFYFILNPFRWNSLQITSELDIRTAIGLANVVTLFWALLPNYNCKTNETEINTVLTFTPIKKTKLKFTFCLYFSNKIYQRYFLLFTITSIFELYTQFWWKLIIVFRHKVAVHILFKISFSEVSSTVLILKSVIYVYT